MILFSGDKLKLPTRSNSFGKNEKKTSVAAPLVAGDDGKVCRMKLIYTQNSLTLESLTTKSI